MKNIKLFVIDGSPLYGPGSPETHADKIVKELFSFYFQTTPHVIVAVGGDLVEPYIIENDSRKHNSTIMNIADQLYDRAFEMTEKLQPDSVDLEKDTIAIAFFDGYEMTIGIHFPYKK